MSEIDPWLKDSISHIRKRVDATADKLSALESTIELRVGNLEKKVYKKKKISIENIINKLGAGAEFLVELHPLIKIAAGILTLTGFTSLILKLTDYAHISASHLFNH